MRPTLSAAGACVITDCGSIPWDAERGRPIDHEGEAGRLYARALAEYGMTEPDPYAAPPVDLTAYAMARRDVLIDGGVVFNGTMFQSRPTDRENIQGAFSLALAAILGGSQPGDLRWNPEQPDADFGFIALDNSIVPMDAQTVVAFGRAAAGRKSALIFAARIIKDRIAAGTITTTAEIDAAFAVVGAAE